MDLKNFPMDVQTCIMQLESCKYEQLTFSEDFKKYSRYKRFLMYSIDNLFCNFLIRPLPSKRRIFHQVLTVMMSTHTLHYDKEINWEPQNNSF